MTATGLAYDPVYKAHVPGRWHPEAPWRCDAALAGIEASVGLANLERIAPRAATDDELALCHTRRYIGIARRDVASGIGCLSTGDTDVCERSLEAALFAAGGVLAAVDAVAAGRVRNAFCAVRPPGHHATPDRGMGFCIFNNLAVGVRYAQRRHGAGNALIVDWDVHHGNGTQEIFYDDPTVLYFSTHQWPHYPGTGTAAETGSGAGKGLNVNCPLGAGAGRREIEAAFRDRLLPRLKDFKPEFVFVSAGFDGLRGDPLGGLDLTAEDFGWLTRLVTHVAEEYAGGRLVSTLEGGYDREGLGPAVGAHVKALAEG
ncbi:MAG: histone deacetylase [Lentisphaerae bacterium]|nr:histone deacetylase [Lentisphaerota bacterium]